MPDEYTSNHYVPIWYQKRFLPFDQNDQELYYLDLKPDIFTDSRGVPHTKKPIRHWGFKQCFATDDLYTLFMGEGKFKEIEQLFFGQIDSRGRRGVEYFTQFQHPSNDSVAFHDLLVYMSTQKLRTPKGLDWLSNQVRTKDKNQLLQAMVKLRALFCATWTECVWLIADASKSGVKFIVSDHPVTVYNRRCGPRSQWCRGDNDPDIRFQATHTIFPLTLDKILIFTNLSWIRNPYQSETTLRPNPKQFREAILKSTQIQTLRHLNEQEVLEINFIIKSRARRYIAAAKKEWLFPDDTISKSQWNQFGEGYLLMPDPRPVHLGGEIIIGNKDGSSTSYDEYGRRPWEAGYGREGRTLSEALTFERFKGEFARLFGPYRRGRTFEGFRLDDERDSDSFHQYHLDLENRHRRRR